MSVFLFVLGQNFNRPAKEIALDLIYLHNRYKVPPPAIQFAPPKELDQRPEIEDDPNTYVLVNIDRKVDARFTGYANGFMYRRLPLAGIVGDPDYVIPSPAFPFTTHDILDQINEQLGTQFTEDDIEETTFTSTDDEPILRASGKSLVWIGFRHIKIQGFGTQDVLFTDDILDGFYIAD